MSDIVLFALTINKPSNIVLIIIEPLEKYGYTPKAPVQLGSSF